MELKKERMIYSTERNMVKHLPYGLAVAGEFMIILNVSKYELMFASLFKSP